MTSITHIITGLNVGGAEQDLYKLLTNGLEGPFKNRVISLTDEGHYGPLLEDAGIPVTYLRMNPGRPSYAGWRRLRAVCNENPSDILHGWMYHGNLAAILVQSFAQSHITVIWTILTSFEVGTVNKFSTKAIIRLGAWLSHKPNSIIYNSHRGRRQFEKIGYKSANGCCIPNGFDTDKWRPDPSKRQGILKSLGLEQDFQVIGYVGRGHADKDLPNLFSAFELISDKHPRARLVCVGRDITPSGKLNKQILCLGERSDVPDIMQCFDLLCLSSKLEGFPNVIGEAMASGVPCVSTAVGDAGVIIGDTGWIAPSKSPTKLAECLDKALSCEPKELQQRGLRARKRIVENYSISSVVEMYKSLYHSIFESSY